MSPPRPFTHIRPPASLRARCGSTVLLLAAGAAGAAEGGPKVTVQALPRFEDLSCRRVDGELEVRARLIDDVGNPLAEATVVAEAERGAQLSTRACGSSPRRARGAPLRTDADGGVCVLVSGSSLAGALTLRFAGDALHLAAHAQLPLEPADGELHLAFDSPSLELSLDQAEQRLTLELSGAGAKNTSLPTIALQLEEGGRLRPIAARDWAREGHSLRFSVDSSQLGAPGPARLLARVTGAGRSAGAVAEAVALRSATVQLEPDAVTPGRDTTELRIRAQSRAGVPTSGWIDASRDGQSLASSPLAAGLAVLQVPASASSAVVVRYHSDDPWWLAGPELLLDLGAPAASEPARWPWLVLLAPVGYICVRSLERPGVRKPRRSARRSPPVAPRPLLREPLAAPASGWAGTVTDAHDGRPIAGAEVEASLPTLLAQPRGVSTRSDEHGRYVLPPLREPIPEGAQLRVRSRWHADFQLALPPQGRVDVTLTSRRRALLGRLVRWARAAGPPWHRAAEPTPAEVANVALRRGDEKTARWAEGIQAAAFAAEEVDAQRETALRADEPAWQQAPARPERPADD